MISINAMQSRIGRKCVTKVQRGTINSRFSFDRPLLLGRRKTLCSRRFSGVNNEKDEGSMYLVQAGLPMFLFCGLGVWVVSSGIDGKNRERDAFQGRISKYVITIVISSEFDSINCALY